MAHKHPATKGMSAEERSKLPHYDKAGGVKAMPGGKSPGPSIKDPEHYEKLKKHFMEQGMSEEEAQTKAARISNAQAEKG